jgi:hypothetical protein
MWPIDLKRRYRRPGPCTRAASRTKPMRKQRPLAPDPLEALGRRLAGPWSDRRTGCAVVILFTLLRF